MELPEESESILRKHIIAIEGYAEFHASKFRSPAPGYHTYWSPHTYRLVSRQLDRMINAISQKIIFIQ